MITYHIDKKTYIDIRNIESYVYYDNQNETFK